MRARPPARALALAALLGALAAPSPWAGRAAAQSPEAPHDATSHEPFKGVEKWTRIFDDPKRDEWQKPQEVVLALGREGFFSHRTRHRILPSPSSPVLSSTAPPPANGRREPGSQAGEPSSCGTP